MRVSRTRSVPWKLNWEDKDNDRLAYLGRHYVGRVVRGKVHRSRVVCFAVYLNLPGVIGPVAHEQSRLLACQKLLEKVQEWLGGCDENIPSKEEGARVRRSKKST